MSKLFCGKCLDNDFIFCVGLTNIHSCVKRHGVITLES